MDESSREVANLFQAYGAVDHHVDVNLGSDPARIRRLLPIYKYPGAHWFRRFVTAAPNGQRSKLDDPQTRIDKALKDFAKSNPPGRMRARRLYAVAVAAQAFPDIPARTLAAAALGPDELEDGPQGDARAEKFAALARSKPETDTQAGRDAWWERLLDPWLIPDPGGLGPRPCSGTLSWVTRHGDRDLVPTLKTVFDARLRFDDAEEFCLDPTTWECFPSWCEMQPHPDGDQHGFRRYREVVSFDCDNKAFPRLTVDLNFHTERQDKPARRVLTEYWLSDDQPEHDVIVNQGWLEVEELSPDTVRVTTTKSVMFSPELGGPGLASMSCRVGYLSMVGDLITCASKEKGEKGYPDTRFRGRTPPRQTRRPDRKYGDLLSLMVDETATACEDAIDEWATGPQTSYRTAQGMGDYWVRMLRGGARFADAGLRVARTAPRAPPRGKP